MSGRRIGGLSLLLLTRSAIGVSPSLTAIAAVEVGEDAVEHGGELIHFFAREEIEEVPASGGHVPGRGFGELGDGTGIGWMQPALVAGGLPFVQVSAGDDHSCGVTADQRAYRWGDNARAVMAGSVTALTLAASPQREWREV